ncbi:sel1 repeat family protein [Paraburkholderia sp. SIMBA_053]|uniref:sel1 repeat family protein n=1 Tax=Paraburkholderia sp. SIMBA_053 TaxID=3085794 RepID=UPI00397889BF
MIFSESPLFARGISRIAVFFTNPSESHPSGWLLVYGVAQHEHWGRVVTARRNKAAHSRSQDSQGALESGALLTDGLLTMQMESWVGTIEREWQQLRCSDSTLDVEKFARHVVAASKTGFLSPESLAAIANALLISTLEGAACLGRRLLERIGANRHPAWRVAMAISLVTPTGGEADLDRGNAIFEDVMNDETADGRLRGLAAAALADSARLGRGIQPDVSRALSLYEQAVDLGYKAAAQTLGFFWEGVWGADDNSVEPDRTKAMQSYRRGGDDVRCQRRLQALR